MSFLSNQVALQDSPSVAAVYDRRQRGMAAIFGGHRPPLQGREMIFTHARDRGGILAKLLLLLAALCVLGAILWVLLLPSLITSTICSKTGFAVKVDSLSVNPFTADVAIKGLVIGNPEGWPVAEFIDLREFRAETNLFSLFSNRFVADEVVLDVAQVTLVRDRQGALNAEVFKDGLAGKEPATGGPKPGGAKPEFLIKRLVLRFDRLVFADHSGRKPRVKEYKLGLNRELRDVDSVKKILSPFSGATLGLLTDTLGGVFKGHPELFKGTADRLEDAGKKVEEKLKGLLDSLDKKKP